jgi:hypothetical protein
MSILKRLNQGAVRVLFAASLLCNGSAYAAASQISSAPSIGYDLSRIDAKSAPMFKVTRGQIVLTPEKILRIEDADKQGFKGTITLDSQDLFTVMESKKLSDGSLILRLGLDSDFSAEPNVIWVHESALKTAAVEFVDQDRPDNLNLFSSAADYADDDMTPLEILLSQNEDGLGELVRSDVAGKSWGRRRHHGGMTYCLRDVRVSLARMGICHSSSFGAAAANAYSPIKSQCGMKPVAYSPDLPKGSVCISSGGNHRCGGHACGHAAVKIGAGAWKGAGVRPTPVLSNHGAPHCLTPQ